ncbi:hypothetical protein [Streptomyces boluensis]|uniref:Uncharacterized protein n=1 Tax=Streptomyces boluensis TaxID=1775135 RepID=A0A964XLR7_9ACTN|nr:hypothetical protein [Streptomyces boluensis]NBE53620.1 hypothetical protein [Streptomyces boluensis]
MNATSPPASYRCEVLAVGPVYGGAGVVSYVLGAFRTISPVLALRWLWGRALWIADRLDPDPEGSRWVRPAMRMPVPPAPDGPAELRAWCAAGSDGRAARERIKRGDPLSLSVPDADCTYTFSIWPETTTTHKPDVRSGRSGSHGG